MSVTSSTTGAVDTSITAIAAAGQRLNRDAAQAAVPGSDPTGALLDADQGRLAAQAAVAVIRTSNAMLGTLLDVRA